MELAPQEFKDKNGKIIKAGDLLLRQVFARCRERPGHKRVAIESMSGREVIVSDEGALKDPQEHWIEYRVMWDGACMIAKRENYSDFQVLMQAELFNAEGKRILEGSGFHYMNKVFDSTVYEVVSETEPSQ